MLAAEVMTAVIPRVIWVEARAAMPEIPDPPVQVAAVVAQPHSFLFAVV